MSTIPGVAENAPLLVGRYGFRRARVSNLKNTFAPTHLPLPWKLSVAAITVKWAEVGVSPSFGQAQFLLSVYWPPVFRSFPALSNVAEQIVL